MSFEQLRLRSTHEAYYFTPLIEPAKEAVTKTVIQTLTVYRDSGELQLNAPPIENARMESEIVVYGILGFIRLQAGEYMIVITGCTRVGTLVHDVFRATSFQILPIARSTHTLSNQQLNDEQTYIHLLENHLKQNGFYFSYRMDLTLSVQKQAQVREGNDWRNADTRFFWNRYLCEKMISATSKTTQDFSRFILPVIQGFVSIASAVINHRAVTFALISRRSQERAGTRYFSRGLDEHGNASNFVETEQLVLCDPSKSLQQNNAIQISYVQTRGSVPAIWGQMPNTRYTPKLWIDAADNQHVASRAHFDKQIQLYGPQILVNLVNTKGYEFPVGQVYASIVKELNDPNLKYIHFDFHHECRKMRWHRVQLLVDQLEPDLRKQGYCLYDATDATLRKMQTSVVRTNCMDCLDRTNVVQSTLARWVLNQQLREVGILQSTEVIENDEPFMQIFKNMWADNADALSIPYSGTGALKTDFTRTGSRTRVGVINDFTNSAIRYIKNNYMDGSRQDGIDLMLGKYLIISNNSSSSPYAASPQSLMIKAVPLLFVVFFGIFMMTLFAPELLLIQSSMMYIVCLAFSFSVVVTCWLFIQQNGSEFVDWPKLVPYQLPHGEVVIEERQQQQYVPMEVVQKKAVDLIHKWKTRRNSTIVLNEAEQGYELAPTTTASKKTT